MGVRYELDFLTVVKDGSEKSILFYLNFSLHYKIIPKYAIISQINSSE